MTLVTLCKRSISVCMAMFALVPGAASAQTAGSATDLFRKDVEPLLKTHCYSCHGDGEKSGNIAFDALKTEKELIDPNLWFKALQNVRAGLMPAGDSPKLSKQEQAVFEKWIKSEVFKIDPVNPDPGRVTLRRLNRTEYRNTIRDLMGYDFKVEEEFPADDTGYGFDTIGDVLSISPMLLEKYMQAAETIVPASVGIINKVIPEYTIPGARFFGRQGANGNNSDRVSFFTGGTFSQPINIERAGEYRIILSTSVHGSFDFDPGRAKMGFKLGDEQLFEEEMGWQDGTKHTYTAVRQLEPGNHNLMLNLAEIKPDGATTQPDLAPPDANQVAAQANSTAPGRRTNVDLRLVNVRIEGPLDRTHWKAPPNYTRFFTLAEPPAADPQRRAYARELLENFATRAFRRPIDVRTLDKLVAIAESAYTQPGKQFEQGIQQAMIAMLASPRFIFRIEETANVADKDKAFAPIDEYALASRLSYFLWSTMPDAELFDLARRGQLRANQEAQVKRLLADPRSEAFVQSFTGQWLQIRDIDTIQIDPRVVLARDAGTEAQLRAEDEAQRLAQAGRRGGRGARGQQANPNAIAAPAGQAPAAGAIPAANAQPAPAVAQTPQTPPAAAQQAPQPVAAAQTPPAAAPPAPQVQAAEVAAALPQPPPPGAAAPVTPPNAPVADPGARGARGARGQLGNRGGRAGGAPAVTFDTALRRSMRQETEMYFSYVVHEDRSVLELIDSNYTFLNPALARHYKLPEVTGNEMRRVELPEGSPRGGVLTQGSILAVTSNPTRTSPVKRGLFILENILGTPPPPPPDDIPPLEDTEKSFNGREPTVRESLQLHRDAPLCQSCHERMDPLGLALENFNAMGMWRDKERNQPLEVSGQLASGEKLASVIDLKKVIRNERRFDFYHTLTEKLMTYALGRGTTYSDVETIDQIVQRLEANEGKFSAILMGVIESPAFQKRRNLTVPVAAASAQPLNQVSQTKAIQP